MIQNGLTHPIFQIVSQESETLGFKTFVIGGYVRDLYLNRKSKDVDFVTVGSGIILAQAVKKRLRIHHQAFLKILEQPKLRPMIGNLNLSVPEKSRMTEKVVNQK